VQAWGDVGSRGNNEAEAMSRPKERAWMALKPRSALQPEDLDRPFLERAMAGDVDGVVDLSEPGAVLAFRQAA
jgi:hypothetical protein